MRFLRALVGDERCKTLVAPEALLRNLRGRGLAFPRRRGAVPLNIVPDARRRQVRDIAAEPGHIALAVIGDAARRVQLDGLEGTHEGPAKAQAVGDRVIEVLGAHVAVLHEPKGLREKCHLQAIEDEAIDLALHGDRHLAHALEVCRARRFVSGEVQGAPHSSTTGTRCGGFTGCATMQRARPASASVNFDATMADVDEARMALAGAARSSCSNVVRFTSSTSGPHSCTYSAPATASSSVAATEMRFAAEPGSETNPWAASSCRDCSMSRAAPARWLVSGSHTRTVH